jgi:hypothetical protein
VLGARGTCGVEEDALDEEAGVEEELEGVKEG